MTIRGQLYFTIYKYRLVMKFLLDSCISSFAVKDIRDAGFDVS